MTVLRQTLPTLAVIPGDGIGPEVTAEALKVLEVAAPAGVKFEPTRYDLGAERYLATGEVLPDSVLAEIREHDAILLGAVGGKPGDPNLPPGHPRARAAAAAAVRARPLRQPAAVPDLPRRHLAARRTPGDVDFVVVREGTEGPYTGNGGALRVGTPHEVATEVSRQHGVRRGAGRARRVRPGPAPAPQEADPGPQDQRARPRRRASGRGWSPRSRRSSPTSTVDYIHVDAATIFLTTDPARFDVIVTDNLFGDIITDLAAAITGGIGLAASGNINPDRTAPSMFEPVHGSAPDIAGQQKADPTAAILSASLLLDHLGHAEAAAAVERGRHRRPGRASTRRDPAYRRGRRRDRGPSSRLTAPSDGMRPQPPHRMTVAQERRIP